MEPTAQEPQAERSRYQQGDAVVDQLGCIKLADGREVWGVLMRFPAGPPNLPLTTCWDGTPFLLTPRAETDRK